MRTRSGDREALEHLIERHQGWIYNIALRMLHHPTLSAGYPAAAMVRVASGWFVVSNPKAAPLNL
jgi:hypothetical protein